MLWQAVSHFGNCCAVILTFIVIIIGILFLYPIVTQCVSSPLHMLGLQLPLVSIICPLALSLTLPLILRQNESYIVCIHVL